MLALGLVATVMFSCEPEDEGMQPINDGVPSGDATLPHFDESNSEMIQWEQLPDDLTQAIPLENEASENENARTNFSEFSFHYGPFGGTGGKGFAIIPPSGSRIYAIGVRAGAKIDKLLIWYKRSNGSVYLGGSPGGNGGNYYVHLFASDEHLKAINGMSSNVINQLGFVTNKKSFTYGAHVGEGFYASVPPNYQLLGFWGKAGALLDQLGFYVFTI